MTRRRTVQTFDRDARGGRRARRMVADKLDAWGLTSERKPLELIVSELFTNAVRHGVGTVEIRLSVDDDVIRVEVCDEGGGRPVLRRPDPSGPELGGWGLQMVDQLTEAWGAIVDDSHTLVWAELLVRHLADRDAR